MKSLLPFLFALSCMATPPMPPVPQIAHALVANKLPAGVIIKTNYWPETNITYTWNLSKSPNIELQIMYQTTNFMLPRQWYPCAFLDATQRIYTMQCTNPIAACQQMVAVDSNGNSSLLLK